MSTLFKTCGDTLISNNLLSICVDTYLLRFEYVLTVFRCRHLEQDMSTLHSHIQVRLHVSTLLVSLWKLSFLSIDHFNFFKMSSSWICMIFNIFNLMRFMISSFICLRLYQIIRYNFKSSGIDTLWISVDTFGAKSALRFSWSI